MLQELHVTHIAPSTGSNAACGRGGSKVSLGATEPLSSSPTPADTQLRPDAVVDPAGTAEATANTATTCDPAAAFVPVHAATHTHAPVAEHTGANTAYSALLNFLLNPSIYQGSGFLALQELAQRVRGKEAEGIAGALVQMLGSSGMLFPVCAEMIKWEISACEFGTLFRQPSLCCKSVSPHTL